MSRAHALLCILTLGLSLPFRAQAQSACPEVIGDDNYDVVSGDFNGDGLADVAVSANPSKIAIFLGNSGVRPVLPGGIISTGARLPNLATADLNGDGALDLIAGSSAAGYVRVMPGDGHGSFAFGEIFPTVTSFWGLKVADFNGDSNADLMTFGNQGVSVLLGDGAGHLSPGQTVLSGYVFSAAAGDVNEDGRADIVTATNENPPSPTPRPLLVFVGNSDGSFTALPPQATSQSTTGVALGDMNEDGHLDVIAGAVGPRISIFQGRGDGSFVTDAPFSLTSRGIWDSRIRDLDLDGHLDVVASSQSGIFLFCPEKSLYVHHGLGDGTLAPGVAVPRSANQISFDLGDLNGDGYPDAIAPQCSLLNPLLGSPSGLKELVNPGRAFTIKNNDVIRLNSNKANWCVQVEWSDPASGFDVRSVGYVRLLSQGTGSQTSIPTSNKGFPLLGDSDENGIQEATFCFSKDQLRLLFSSLQGRRTVDAVVEGGVGAAHGCLVQAPLTVEVISGGIGQGVARMIPNVFATESMLSLETPERGRVRAWIFDVSGRLVRTLMDGSSEAGLQRIRVEARDAGGKVLPSGVYFFRIESPNGPESGRFVIAR